MAKKKKNTKKKSKKFNYIPKEKTENIQSSNEPQELVNVNYTGAPTTRGRKRSKIRIDKPKGEKFRKVNLTDYNEYKAVEAILDREEITITRADLHICVKIGAQKIEQDIELLKVLFPNRDRATIRTIILDALSSDIEEIKTWKALKGEIDSIKLLNTRRLFERARLLLYQSLLPLENDPLYSLDLFKIQKAGEMIYRAKGARGMSDKILWNFIPESCYDVIKQAWNQIGKQAA